MGIAGLLPSLKSVVDQVNIRKYSGKTIGIDASGWLYHGAYSCARDLVLGNTTDVFLNYSIQQIELFRQHNVRPLFVFDGASLPAKLPENEQRKQARLVAKEKAMQLWHADPQNVPFGLFAKAMTVTNDMIMQLIQVLRNLKVEFIVAPYEADAQLAFLSKTRLVDAVISEDSDCIPYGCKAVLFKWNADGWADEIRRKNLGANEDLCFVGWSEEMFLQFCVLCGCDYCPSVYGIGVKTAHRLVEQHRNPHKVLRALRSLKPHDVPAEYEINFAQAILTFRHHLVYDPRHKRLSMLNPLSNSSHFMESVGENLEFLGNMDMSDELVVAIANADVNPFTHESYDWTNEIAELEAKASSPRTLTIRPSSVTSTESNEEASTNRSHYAQRISQFKRPSHLPVRHQVNTSQQRPASSGGKENHDRHSSVSGECSNPPSWRHLDSVLGSSSHILNFGSPNIGENFRSLVSRQARAPSLQGFVLQRETKCRALATATNGKRRRATISKPDEDANKRRVFKGQVCSRAEVTKSSAHSSPPRSQPFPSPLHSSPSRISTASLATNAVRTVFQLQTPSSSTSYYAASEVSPSLEAGIGLLSSSTSSPLASVSPSPTSSHDEQDHEWKLGLIAARSMASN